jgi:hypothetical protein
MAVRRRMIWTRTFAFMRSRDLQNEDEYITRRVTSGGTIRSARFDLLRALYDTRGTEERECYDRCRSGQRDFAFMIRKESDSNFVARPRRSTTLPCKSGPK